MNCGKYVARNEMYFSKNIGSLCTPECFREWRTAEAHRRSTTVKRLNRNVLRDHIPDTVRRRVFARDGARCRVCGGIQMLHLHHIDYRSQGGRHDDWNLVTLCARHHELVHSNKRRYQPLLRGMIWRHMAEGIMLQLGEFEIWYHTIIDSSRGTDTAAFGP